MSVSEANRSNRAATIVTIVVASLLAVSPALFAREHDILQVKRLSDRILTISSYTSNGKVAAVKSEKGIVLINTFWSPSIALEAAEIIARESA